MPTLAEWWKCKTADGQPLPSDRLARRLDCTRDAMADEQRTLLDAATLAAGKATSAWARDEPLLIAAEQQPAKPARKKRPQT
ncbi:MAG TPA: hypothetical protein VM165_15285 [Planctomycetaceae bacterium]|nr:hypothetical protein [Planctomycetaceae bacterium]